MSKRNLKKYLSELKKKQLEEQIMELYEKFTAVKTYYDFVFNPKEDKLLQECKSKIYTEYFPPKKPNSKDRKPKMRRSIAQKYIKHYISLGVDSFIIGDIMLYNIEIAQSFSSEKAVKLESFYKSMFNSFEQAVSFIISNGILDEFKPRILAINDKAIQQNWFNCDEFSTITERFDW